MLKMFTASRRRPAFSSVFYVLCVLMVALSGCADNTIRLLTGVQFPMTFTDKGNGHKVTVDADETFDKGVLWQQDAENFVCMEPWNGWANSVNEEGRHEVLNVDEAMTSEWSITIEKV